MLKKTLMAMALVAFSIITIGQTASSLYNIKPNSAAMKLIKKGKKSIESNDLNTAKKSFHKALKKSPLSFQASAYLGIIDGQEGNFNESVKWFQKSLVDFEAYKKHLIERKTDYLKTMELDAITRENELNTRKVNYKPLLQVSSKGVLDSTMTRHISQGNPTQQLMDINNMKDRVKKLKSDLEKDKSMQYPAFFYFKFGNILTRTNNIEHAKMLYLNAIASDAEFKDTYPNLAVLYFMEKDCGNAKAVYLKAKELNATINPAFEKDLLATCQ